MSKRYKKALAAILAAAMVLGSSLGANAARGSGEGTGSLDIVLFPEVFHVVLPTSAGNQFDYILDPTGLIAKTGSTKYPSSSFTPGKTMYFRHEPASGSNIAVYDDMSDPITAYNKSNIDVEIKVQAKLSTPKGIIIASSSVAGDTSTDPKMYMALTEGTKSTEKPITVQGIVATASIASAKAHYITVYDAPSDTYKKVLNASASSAPKEQYGTYFKFYSFRLTGDCNSGGKWEDVKNAPPAVSLVWSIDKKAGAATGDASLETPDTPNVPGPGTPGTPTVTLSDTGFITIDGLTGALNYGNSVTLTYDGQTSENLDRDENIYWTGSDWTLANGGKLQIQLKQAWLKILKGKTVTVTVRLSDGSTITATEKISG